MTNISTSTYFLKRVLPTVWFGIVFVSVVTSFSSDGVSIFGLFVSAILALGGYKAFNEYAWDLADEVHDHGNRLVFRKGKLEQTVMLNDIVNVSYSKNAHPQQVTVRVRKEGKIGRDLSFSPKGAKRTLFGGSESPVVADLIDRIDRARTA